MTLLAPDLITNSRHSHPCAAPTPQRPVERSSPFPAAVVALLRRRVGT